jgi:hypothetical protein
MYDEMQVLSGNDGTVTAIEAVTIDPELATEAMVRAKLGEPEYVLKLITQTMADYSEKGVRFIFDKQGKTIGIAYVPHLRRRVHEGARQVVNLSELPTGPPGGGDASADFSKWRAGTAIRQITPLKPEWVPKEGWKVHDDLHARVLYLTDGKVQVCLVGADLFGMSYRVVRDFIDAVREKGCGEMIMGMSHNHAAPDTIGIYGHFPKEYVDYIGKQIVAACVDAKGKARLVGAVRAAAKEMPLTGARVHGWFRNARNPGIVDPQIAVIKIDAADGKTIATVVNFACHVEGLAAGVMEMSADFPGYMCNKIQENLGGTCVFLNGALGGMVSGDTPFRTHECAEKFGLELAVELPTTNSRLLIFATMMQAARKEQLLKRGRMVTEMHYLQIGSAQFCTIPGELLPEISFEILETMKGYPRMIVGLANDEIGYIIPAADFRAGGNLITMKGWAYEETMSVGPVAGPLIKEYGRRIVLDNQTGF